MSTLLVTLAQVAGLSRDSVASMIGRQAPLLTLVVLLVLVAPVDGRRVVCTRGRRETWAPVPAPARGFAFAAAQFAAADCVSVQLAHTGAVLLGATALMAVPAHVSRPEEPVPSATSSRRRGAGARLSAAGSGRSRAQQIGLAGSEVDLLRKVLP